MSDRELLELAAKAAGINPLSVACGPGTWWDSESRTTYTCWNPLTSDGDALRLAVKLGLTVTPNYHVEHASAGVLVFTEIDAPEDPCAATRRAIVRAAASIGRDMK